MTHLYKGIPLFEKVRDFSGVISLNINHLAPNYLTFLRFYLTFCSGFDHDQHLETHKKAPKMADATSQFVDFMRSCGIGPHDQNDIIADDKNRRYRVEGDPVKTRNGQYQLREAPDGFAFGYARSYKQGVTHKWHTKASRNASPEERDAWKQRADDARKEQARQIAELAEKAAIKAAHIWDNATKTGGNGYTARKGIDRLHGARLWRDMVVVPMRIAGRITGLQFISPEGAKRFLTGSAKEGAYHAMADKGESLSRIIIAEGYATAVKLRDALA
ncbi:MAG: hypothetical protein ACRCYS_14005, partial [Beijerinckiaceae bacterium]